MFAFRADAEPWAVHFGTYAEMADMYNRRHISWTQIALAPVFRGPAGIAQGGITGKAPEAVEGKKGGAAPAGGTDQTPASDEAIEGVLWDMLSELHHITDEESAADIVCTAANKIRALAPAGTIDQAPKGDGNA